MTTPTRQDYQAILKGIQKGSVQIVMSLGHGNSLDVIESALTLAAGTPKPQCAKGCGDLAEALENLINEHEQVLAAIGIYEDGHKILTGIADEITPAKAALAAHRNPERAMTKEQYEKLRNELNFVPDFDDATYIRGIYYFLEKLLETLKPKNEEKPND